MKKKRRQPPIPPKELREIWAAIPSIKCQGKCVNSCGPLPIRNESPERKLVEAHGGRRLQTEGPRNACTFLTERGLCSVYSVRPTICRLWGVVEAMRCPHGCEPERMLSDEEGFDLLARAEGEDELDMPGVLAAMTEADRELLTRFLRQGEDLTPKSPIFTGKRPRLTLMNDGTIVEE